jgi:ABC-type transport system involved in cytochrome bd biosynthesis fused ATPase/permease subunit
MGLFDFPIEPMTMFVSSIVVSSALLTSGLLTLDHQTRIAIFLTVACLILALLFRQKGRSNHQESGPSRDELESRVN